VKPECCDASYASDTGCVCTTPQQRNYINMRGGNRTVEDGVIKRAYKLNYLKILKLILIVKMN
jgi:hypothetical protein